MADPLADLVATMPFATSLGITLDAATKDEVVGRMAWAPDRTTLGGALHGGALMAFADSVGAVCAYLNLPEGAGTATTGSATHFFRGVREGEVVATARPVHVGGTLVVVRTELRDGQGRLVAETTATQAVLAR